MPIVSSGEIALIADIEAEFDQTGTTDISLFQARTDAGLSAGQVAMTDFYGLSDATAPTVATYSHIGVTSSSIHARGGVTSDGGASITERGFYLGTSTTATNNTKYTVSGTTGTFTRNITGLSASTTYYYFPYAKNSAGTTIGGYRSVTTSALSASTLFSSFGSSYLRAPSGGNDGTCAYNSQTSYCRWYNQGMTKTNSTSVTFWIWSPAQTSNNIPTASYNFSGYRSSNTGTQGTLSYGPAGVGTGIGFYMRLTASGYATYNDNYVNRTCI